MHERVGVVELRIDGAGVVLMLEFLVRGSRWRVLSFGCEHSEGIAVSDL